MPLLQPARPLLTPRRPLPRLHQAPRAVPLQAAPPCCWHCCALCWPPCCEQAPERATARRHKHSHIRLMRTQACVRATLMSAMCDVCVWGFKGSCCVCQQLAWELSCPVLCADVSFTSRWPHCGWHRIRVGPDIVVALTDSDRQSALFWVLCVGVCAPHEWDCASSSTVITGVRADQQ